MSLSFGISAKQIKLGRIYLEWTQSDLAKAANVSKETIINLEKGKPPQITTLEKVTQALHDAGIEFTRGNGIRERDNIRILHGRKGFHTFIDDLYETVKAQGGEICVFNVDERNWMKWLGDEKWESHNHRMSLLKHNIIDKIVIKENDWFFLASDFKPCPSR